MYLNKVFIIGNLTRDPEIKATPSGIKVCTFSLATNRSFKDKDGNRKESAEFHNIVAFSKLGELSAQYLRKGSQALVEGRLQNRSWDKADGTKGYRTEIVADNVQFGWKPGAGGSSPVAEQSKDSGTPAPDASAGEKIDYPQEEINPDDIPF